MGLLDNPASRLHAILSRYRDAAERGKPVVTTWCEVFEVDQDELLPVLGQAATLLGQIGRDIEEGGFSDQADAYEAFRGVWGQPFLVTTHAWGATPSPGKSLVDEAALAALRGLAGFLAVTRPEGHVPEAEVIQDLRDQVRGLLDVLSEDASLPPELRLVMSHRLHDILWAMDHVRIGGPDAVAAAVERLLGQVVIYRDTAGTDQGLVQKVMDLASQVWRVFKIGSEANAALEGWESVLHQLPPG